MAKLEEIIRGSLGENCPLFHLDEFDPKNCGNKIDDDTCSLDCCANRAAAALVSAGYVQMAENRDVPVNIHPIVGRMLTPVPIGNGEEEVWAKIRRKVKITGEVKS